MLEVSHTESKVRRIGCSYRSSSGLLEAWEAAVEFARDLALEHTVLLQLSGRVASVAFDLACEGAGRGRPPLWERRAMAGWTDTAGRPAVALP